MEQFFLLLVFLVFALGSHLMRFLRKRMEERMPRETPPETPEEAFPWPWPKEPPPEPMPLPQVAVATRRPAPPPPRAAATAGPAAATARGPAGMRPLLTRDEARRGMVLREILGPCRGLEGLDTPDRVGGA